MHVPFLCVTVSREKLCGLEQEMGGWWLRSAPVTAGFAWLTYKKTALLDPFYFPGQESKLPPYEMHWS